MTEPPDVLGRVVEAAEAAFTAEKWTPRRTVVIGEVMDPAGRRLLIGAASPEMATWDILGMLLQELQVVLNDVGEVAR